MCGICGIVYSNPERTVSPDLLVRMRDSLVHRGPDGAGLHINGAVGLGHRRLAILDLSPRAHQPMRSASGRYWVTYNGEIYNYLLLREELRGKGHRFQSSGDTEVLVKGLEEWGLPGLLNRLDGIFAFAAWDSQERALLAARDPLGVKPLYYSHQANEFVFGSEIKAIWASGVPREVDEDVLEELLVFRFVGGEFTPFRRVRRLLPGHYLVLKNNELTTQPFWRVLDHVGSDPANGEVWRNRFRQAVSDQRISDVALGTLLSGGLDSSSVTAELARASDDPVQTFTVSVPPEEGFDEWPYAEKVARRWDCVSHKLQVPASNVLQRLRVAQSFHDEPLAHGNDMHILEISRLAKQHVTVLLSGEGADETLGGYVRYQPLRYPRMMGAASSWIGAPLRSLMRLAQSRQLRTMHRFLALGNLDNMILFNSVDVTPGDLERIGFKARRRFDERRALIEAARGVTPDPLRQLMLYDQQTFLCSMLNRNDRMTMAASIECRVPFLGVRVVEAALKLPTNALFAGRIGKKILRDHARKLLPESVLNRAKWGLGIPWARYMRNDAACREFVNELPNTDLAVALDAPGLPNTIRSFLSGDDRKSPLVYQLFSLAVWWEQVVNRKLGLDADQPRKVELR